MKTPIVITTISLTMLLFACSEKEEEDFINIQANRKELKELEIITNKNVVIDVKKDILVIQTGSNAPLKIYDK